MITMPTPTSTPEPTAMPTECEIHLEELGQHAWWSALLDTVTGSFGSAQYRFVARAPGADRPDSHVAVGATFPVMRAALPEDTARHTWSDLAHRRLDKLEDDLVQQGWRRRSAPGPHWWSRSYERPRTTTDRQPDQAR